MLLAYIMDDLEFGLKESNIVDKKQDFNLHKLKDMLTECKTDLDPILIDNDPKEIQC